MDARIDKWVDENLENMLSDLKVLVGFRSVEGEALPGKPFGNTVAACLDSALLISKKLGLSGKNLDGYCGIIDDGNGEETLGILCHLDIVPEGDGWEYPPYEGRIVDNKMYGRGTIDDKGPAIAAMYALAAVKNAGYKFNRSVRIILGCNEETGMKCVDYYCKHEKAPTMTFTPDGTFPLSNSEKSIMRVSYQKQYASSIKMNVGEAPNIVPGKAIANVNGKEYFCEGKQTHASIPQTGKNAIQMMFNLLNGENLNGEDKTVISGLCDIFKMEYNGESIGIDKTDASGRQTLNIGIVNWDENGFKITLDLRCPTSVPKEEIKERLDAAFAKIGAVCSDFDYSQGYSLSDDSVLVKSLLKVYKERTGDLNAKPQKMGGGTYARHLPNAVSFGPEGWLCDSECHVANEFIRVDQLLFDTKIIADAIIALACK